MIDIELMSQLVAADTLRRAESAFGSDGLASLLAVLQTVRSAYRWLACETLAGGMTVFRTLDPASRPVDVRDSVQIESLEALPGLVRQELTLQVVGGGTLLVWGHTIDPRALPPDATAYEYRGPGDEHLWVAGASDKVPSIASFPSQFAVPTFFELDGALSYYAVHLARESTCFILSGGARRDREGIWHDDKRGFLRGKPEATMRRSLEQFLRSALRGHHSVDVRPEQNIDETHPVDIEVTWTYDNKVALIEIKWLGQSIGDREQRTEYTEARAHSGATQLADYLDRNRPRATTNIVVGYLVVYDARRRSLTLEQATINELDGRHYAMAEITFDPVLLARHDFAKPHRMFLEPVCT